MAQRSDPVTAVEKTVAGYENSQPGALPPLQEWVGIETYRALRAVGRDRTGPLEFSYLWYRVTVSPSGEVTVRS